MKCLIKTYIYLYFITLVNIVFAYVFTDENGGTFHYVINFKNKCRAVDGSFVTVQGLSIAQCVARCGLRQHCMSLNYRRSRHICELFSSAEEGVVRSGDCVFIPRSDITFNENPCDGQDCTQDKACDATSQTCYHKECSSSMVLQNGQVLGNMNDVGSKIKYECNEGYENKDGMQNAVCLQTGQWSQVAECVTVCGDVPSINNGNISQDPADANAASVSCDAGYQSTKSTISCIHATALWESVSCERIDCGSVPAISDGNINLDMAGSSLYLDTASVSCDTGYQTSVNSITCTTTGSWETASCERKSCGNLPTLANGNIVLNTVNANKYLDQATATCDTSYVASVNPITCTAAGAWEAVTCDIISCGSPPAISNGNTVLDIAGNTLYLDTAYVSCDTGYQASVGIISCTATGSWETSVCDRISCGDLPSFANGDVILNTVNGNKYLDMATVTCDATYIASTNTITCTATGAWETVSCNAISCGDPPTITNGQVNLDMPGGKQYQDTATVACDTWFQASSNSVTCTLSGSWTQATCSDVMCYPGTPWEYQGKVNYTLSGRPCQRWDSQSPHSHSSTDLQYFPDATLAEASNYCRNPESGSYNPWCITTDQDMEWEYCSVTPCNAEEEEYDD